MTRVTLTEYTDPWCTWCWGSEPILRHIDQVYGDQVDIRFVTGGLVEDWDTFQDAANDITQPEHVAPHWEEASAKHGMPVDASIWIDNPPQSTYPSNVAYHAAKIVAPGKADRFLRRMREAAAAEHRNTARMDVLTALAVDVGIDPEAFRDAFDSDEAEQRFRADREDAVEHDATAHPTFHIETSDEETWLRGYRRFDTFKTVFEDEAGLSPSDPLPVLDLVQHYGRVATQEVAEIRGMDRAAARDRLQTLADDGVVTEVPAGNDAFWEPAD